MKSFTLDEQTENILDRLRAGDRKALKTLFEQHYLLVCKAIHRFILDRATVEDLAQEVFMRFWDKREKINITSSVPAYLRRMAINEALAYLRRNKRYQEEEFDSHINIGTDYSVEEQYLQVELEQSVTQAIDTLPPRCRTVFQLSRYEELTYQEIADKMGISIKTVENQMGKALKILRKRLSRYLNFFFF